jgi:hypothetical protein
MVMVLLVDKEGLIKEMRQKKSPHFSCGPYMRQMQSSFGLGLDDLASTVKTCGADVVAQMHFTSGGFDCNAGVGQGIV